MYIHNKQSKEDLIGNSVKSNSGDKKKQYGNYDQGRLYQILFKSEYGKRCKSN